MTTTPFNRHRRQPAAPINEWAQVTGTRGGTEGWRPRLDAVPQPEQSGHGLSGHPKTLADQHEWSPHLSTYCGTRAKGPDLLPRGQGSLPAPPNSEGRGLQSGRFKVLHDLSLDPTATTNPSDDPGLATPRTSIPGVRAALSAAAVMRMSFVARLRTWCRAA